MNIRCEIVSQDRMVFEGDVDIVVLPGESGEMGILPKHAPLLSTLKFGILKVRVKDVEEVFAVSGGVVEVQPDIVTVLADAAENVEEIDIERAMKARENAEERLKTITTSDTDRYLRISAALKRSNLRLQAANKYRKLTKNRIQ